MMKKIPSKYVFLFGILMFFGTLFGISFGNSEKVYAACGADGVGVHGYAGAVIDVVVRRYGGPTVEAPNSVVYVQSLNPSTPGGNIYNLNTGKRYISANFVQINNSCNGTSGSRSVVLGYGTTSQPTGGEAGDWALDCDISVRGDNNQPFLVTSRGTPDGARPLWGPYIDNPNYGWTSVTISPRNGTTARTQIVYREPPPKQPEIGPVNDGNINFVDCRNFTSVGVTKNTAVNVRFIVRWQQFPGSPLQVIANDSRSSTVYSMPVYYGPSTLSNVPYYVDILIFNNNTSNWFRADYVYTDNAPCGQNEQFLPTYSLEVTCEGVWIRGASDRDNVYAGVRFFGVFYHRYDNGGVESWAPVGGSNFDIDNVRGDYLLRWPTNLEDGNNQGWGMHIGNYDTNPLGQKINPYWARSAELEGACKQASCTLDIQESPEVSQYQNGVVVGRPYSGTVTISNPATSVPVSVYRHPDSRDRPAGEAVWQQLGSSSVPNDPLTDTFAGFQLTAHHQNGLNQDVIDFLLSPSQQINRGTSAARTFTMGPPTNIGQSTIAYYPDYTGLYPIGNVCSSEVLFFDQYKIEPNANDLTLSPSREDPDRVIFTSSTEKTIPPGVSIPDVRTERVIKKNGNAFGGTFTAPGNFRAGVPSDTRNFTDSPAIPPPNNLGDAYCAFITVFPAAGWIGPNDRRTVTEPFASDAIDGCVPCTPGDPQCFVCDPTDPNCNPCNPADSNCNPCAAPGAKCGDTRVVNLPYVKTYGGDAVSGGGFKVAGGSCAAAPASGSGILAYMYQLNQQVSKNKSGSGSQLAAMSWGANVSGFTSASMRTAPPDSGGGNKLTFSNTTGSGGGGNNPVLGGNLSGDPPCLPDYFTETQYPNGSLKDNGFSPVTPQSLVTNRQTLVNSDATINGSTGYNKRHTVYVDGDARIAGNIIYSTGGVAEAKDLPNFTLVVRGNIYVDRSVTRLDGTYIAQPTAADPNNTGRIYTCSTGFTGITTSSGMFTQCGAAGGVGRLHVFGSFIAEKVVLNRTINSVRDSTYREPFSFNPANPDAGTKAAEVFVFSPDVYLSPPVFRPKSTVTSGDYQYIATLPPIL